MTAPVFVDTNVLVYSRDSRDSRDAGKNRRAHEWVEFLWDTKRGRVSRQVLHEYYVTVTRKLRPGLPNNYGAYSPDRTRLKNFPRLNRRAYNLCLLSRLFMSNGRRSPW